MGAFFIMDFKVFDKKLEDLTEADWKQIIAYVHNMQHIVKVQIEMIKELNRDDR